MVAMVGKTVADIVEAAKKSQAAQDKLHEILRKVSAEVGNRPLPLPIPESAE